MPPLQRHGLVHLSDAGWSALCAGPSLPADAMAHDCLAHWAVHRLPLVVTRQADCRGPVPATEVALGLPAPARWGRLRIALRVPVAAVLYTDGFPRMAAVASLLPRNARPAWQALQAALAADGLAAAVYGSYGWERLTGLAYRHAASDIDLLVPVDGADAADRAAARLAAAALPGPRIDGELQFSDGAAVAWREWRLWRTGAAAAVLVKRRDGATLETDDGWLCRRGAPSPVAEPACV